MYGTGVPKRRPRSTNAVHAPPALGARQEPGIEPSADVAASRASAKTPSRRRREILRRASDAATRAGVPTTLPRGVRAELTRRRQGRGGDEAAPARDAWTAGVGEESAEAEGSVPATSPGGELRAKLARLREGLEFESGLEFEGGRAEALARPRSLPLHMRDWHNEPSAKAALEVIGVAGK
eukprot:SAG11_NODE_9226_length_931_cov_1.234375_1_plen_180_part_10